MKDDRLQGSYWNGGLLPRSESVSIMRSLAFRADGKQLGALFCAHGIKDALLLPSAALQNDSEPSPQKLVEGASAGLLPGVGLLFLETGHFPAEREQPLSAEAQRGPLPGGNGSCSAAPLSLCPAAGCTRHPDGTAVFGS